MTANADVSWWQTRNGLLVGLVAIAASLLLGSLALLGTGARGRSRTREVLDRYTTVPSGDVTNGSNASPVAKTALEFADRLVTKGSLQDKLALRLARAAVSFTPAEWLLMQFATAVVASCTFLLLAGTRCSPSSAAARQDGSSPTRTSGSKRRGAARPSRTSCPTRCR